jgi:hypothetical protein
MKAGQEARQIPARRGEGGLVEIVHVEIGAPVVPVERAEILADTVRAFRAERIAAREEEATRLREALDHFKREAEIEGAHFKREMEIEIAVLRRLVEIFKGARPSDNMAAHAAQ